MKRTITLLLGAALGALWLAAPAHATPVPAPSPTPTPSASTPADPCALPSPTATIVEGPQAKAPLLISVPPQLPPLECFVEFKDNCEGETQVTLHNPSAHFAIKYQVAEEDETRTVGPGESEVTMIASTFSPFKVWIVFNAHHKLKIAEHTYEPKDCQTASPTPTPVPTPAQTSQEPQLPVTGQNLAPQMWIAGGSLGLAVVAVVFLLVARWRRNRIDPAAAYRHLSS